MGPKVTRERTDKKNLFSYEEIVKLLFTSILPVDDHWYKKSNDYSFLYDPIEKQKTLKP